MTFRTLKTDQVEPVRYNFRRLTRDLMDPPITDPKKVIYSLRSTFSNTMRRAGAAPEVRRAILGHSEGVHWPITTMSKNFSRSVNGSEHLTRP